MLLPTVSRTFSRSLVSSGVPQSSTRRVRASSSSPRHLPATTVATALPMRFVSAGASEVKRSIPRTSLATGTRPAADNVAASTLNRPPLKIHAPKPAVRAGPAQHRDLLIQSDRKISGSILSLTVRCCSASKQHAFHGASTASIPTRTGRGVRYGYARDVLLQL